MRRTRANSRRAAFERPVETLPGACAFADDPEAIDPVWLVRELKCYPQFLAPVRDRVRAFEHDMGRDREPGDWALLYLAYVFSGETRVQRFCARWRSSQVWREAGFGEWAPCYQTVWLRFDELERAGVADAIREAGDLVIAHAKRHEDRIGQDVSFDATSYQAHARLVHCCPDRDACRGLPRFPKRLKTATGETVEKGRHRDAEKAPELTEAGGKLDNRLRELPADDPRRELLPEGPRYYLQHGHIYRNRDASSGARSYDKDFWVGGLLMAAVDVFIGAPIAVRAIAADESEGSHYPELLEQARTASGSYPDRVAGDRGYSISPVFALNSQLGIASVFPWRRHSTIKTREEVDRDEYDRHGIPRCRHCGGPGQMTGAGLGFHLVRGDEPVLRYRCMLQITPECKHEQQISCSLNPRLLIPLNRLTDQYHALSVASKSMERVWHHWRDRYGVAGKHADTRTLRRESRECQELRSQAARLIEWFRILLRNGWAGSHRRAPEAAPKQVSGARRLRSTLRSRERNRVDVPYGRYAVGAGYAPDAEPPPPGDDRPF